MTATETGFAEIPDGRLYFEAAGAGSTVVLIHGGILDSRMWDGQFDAFTRRYRVIRYDVRGAGRSSRPDRPYFHPDDLVALLRALRVERASLVGMSFGGALELDMALDHPEMVEALVLVASGLSGYEWADPTGVTASMRAGIGGAMERNDPSGAVDAWLETWAPIRTPAPVFEAIHRMAHDNAHQFLEPDGLEREPDHPAIDRLAEVLAPSLVVTGAQDIPDMDTIGVRLTDGIPGARRVVIEGADHIVPMRDPDGFNAAVLSFLSEALGT